MAKKLENEIQWETRTIGPEIWLEILKKVENETETLFDLEYGEETEKRGKWDTNSVWPG
jgi:hypothetical protein